jgi:hypothetical protein
MSNETPRIRQVKLFGNPAWVCETAGKKGYGITAAAAYEQWLKSVIKPTKMIYARTYFE